jgi:hypothetical protein
VLNKVHENAGKNGRKKREKMSTAQWDRELPFLQFEINQIVNPRNEQKTRFYFMENVSNCYFSLYRVGQG